MKKKKEETPILEFDSVAEWDHFVSMVQNAIDEIECDGDASSAVIDQILIFDKRYRYE